MKTFNILAVSQNRSVSKLLAIIILSTLLFGESCDQREVKEYEAVNSCFTKEFLENEPWVKDQLAFFQVPKMSFLNIVVYEYRSQYFLAFENTTVSSPMSYIFNCNGKTISELGIHYNEFYDHAELKAILLQEKY